MTELPAAPDAVLDGLLEDWLRLASSGGPIDAGPVLAAHPGRRAEILELLAMVTDTAIVRTAAVPVVPGYELLRELGSGGGGVVWLARQQGLHRLVALKVLHPGLAGDARVRSRLAAEARALAALRHPHVVAIHELVETSDGVAIAMQLADSTLLRAMAARARGESSTPAIPAEPAAFVCRLGASIARALHAAHQLGLVHRDVKPSNVLLLRDGTPLLADFGLVHDDANAVTRTGQFLGTTLYAAPEQLRGAAVDARSDVYALGATLWHALTGGPPFGAATGDRRVALAERTALPRLGRAFPRDLDTILRTCLAPRPADRYPTAATLADDLERLQALRPIAARPAGLAARTRAAFRRRRVAAFTALALLLATIVAFAWSTLAATRRAERPALVAALVQQARAHLLEPGYEERLEYEVLGRADERPRRLTAAAQAALAAYTDALALAPDRDDLRLERELVALTATDARAPTPTGTVLPQRCPFAHAAIVALRSGQPPASVARMPAADRRAFGLFAYLTGRTRACHEAWHDLDLRGDADPLLDAASGLLLHEEYEFAAALPRLLRACDQFPEAGFLAVAVADCLVETGAVEQAGHWLARAQGTGMPDPWERQDSVRAAILVQRGEVAAARAVLQRLFDKWGSPSVLRRLLLLAPRGDVALSRPVPAPLAPLVVELGEAWWVSLSADEVLQQVLHAAAAPEAPLRRLVEALESAESRTPDARSFSPGATVPNRGRPPEVSSMSDSSRVPSNLPRFADCRRLRRVLADSLHLAPARARFATWTALAIEDPLRGRTFGSLASGALLLAAVLLGAPAREALAQTQWVQQSPAMSPTPRLCNPMAYDSQRGVVVMFGGNAAGIDLGDTWEWDGTTWSLRSTAGPSPRAVAVLEYDRANGCTVLFGGGTAAGVMLNDTWSWNGSTWTQRFPAQSPPPRRRGASAYCTSRQRLVLFGGGTAGSTVFLDDTWEWDGTDWLPLTPAVRPAGRFDAMMAFDAVRDRCLLFGGYSGLAPNGYFGDTWEWTGTAWTQLTPTLVPPARGLSAMCFDRDRQRIVLAGGTGGVHPAGSILFNDTWEWDGMNWQQRAAGPLRQFHGLAYDEARRKVVLFGGGDGAPHAPTERNDTWTYGPDNPANFTTFGTACTGTAGTPLLTCPDLPWLGDTLRVDVAPIPVVALPFFVIGFSNTFSAFGPLPVNLTILGLTGCFLNVSLDVFELVPNLGGTARWSLAIPYTTSLLGAQLHLQGGTSDLLANPFGAVLSGGATITVGER